MYICTHASTFGTTAWKQLHGKPDLKPGSSTLLPVRAAHHTITTACHPDFIHSSVMVRDQSTRSLAAPAVGHGRDMISYFWTWFHISEITFTIRVHILAIFPPFFQERSVVWRQLTSVKASLIPLSFQWSTPTAFVLHVQFRFRSIR